MPEKEHTDIPPLADALPFLFESEMLFYLPEEPEEQDREEEQLPAQPQYRGVPEARVHIWVTYPETDFFPEADWDFLKKVLAAVKLDEAQVCVLNAPPKASRAATAFSEGYQPDFLLAFGLAQEEEGKESYSLYEWQTIDETTRLLSADPLEKIMEDVSLKRLLWTALKQANF